MVMCHSSWKEDSDYIYPHLIAPLRIKQIQKLKALKNIAYCVEGYVEENNQKNFGNASEWARHLKQALNKFEEISDESFYEYSTRLLKEFKNSN